MAQLPILKFIFDRHKRSTPNKTGSIELQITFHRKAKFIATGVRVLQKEWKSGQVVNRFDAMELNVSLGIIMSNARRIVSELLASGELDLAEIPKRMRASQEKSVDSTNFVDYIKERAEVRKYGKTADSQDRYDRFIKFFLAWGVIKEFDDITEANIIEMDKVLAGKNLKDNSKWNNYHRFLNSFIMDAVDDGLLRRNPYKHVRINKDKDSKSLWKHLTIDEFKKLEKAEMPTDSLRQVRDLFVFQTYTCLSYVDLCNFDWSNAKDMSGKKLYTGQRGKTKQEFSFMLLKPALAILKRYKGTLPIISNEKYNAYLKAVAQFSGIDKPLTSHWARHTGATILLNMGVDMEVVAKILGHSNTKMTRAVYAKLLDETVVNAMADVEKKLAR